MTTTEKLKKTNNPLYFSNARTEALEEALRMFLEAFEEYSSNNELTDEQISSFKQLILDSYIEQRALYFIDHKFSNFNHYINKSMHIALKQLFDKDENEDITKLFYYNNKNRMISNEQY